MKRGHLRNSAVTPVMRLVGLKLFPGPVQVVCSQEMSAPVGGWNNGIS